MSLIMALKPFSVFGNSVLHNIRCNLSFLTSKLQIDIQQKCCKSTSDRWRITVPRQEVIKDNTEEDKLFTKDIISKVNKHILDRAQGRLFAIIHVHGKQYRVAEEDIIMLEGYFAPTAADVISFPKVLLVAGPSFTLIGKPIVPSHVVSVTGTVVEKDLSHIRTVCKHIKRKRHLNITFVRKDITTIRFNKIRVYPNINEMNAIQDVDRVMH